MQISMEAALRISSCRLDEHPHGLYVEVDVNNVPTSTRCAVLAEVYQLKQSGPRRLKGAADPFKSDDGGFLAIGDATEGRAHLYVPWNALRARRDRRRQAIIKLTAVGNEDQSDVALYECEVRTQGDFSLLDYYRPLIGLAMAVAYADGLLTRSEVRVIREIFEEKLGLPKGDSGLRRLLAVCPPTNLRPIARAALHRLDPRLPVKTVQELVWTLELVAGADGVITDDEIQIIDQVCRALQAPAHMVADLRERAAKTGGDPWVLLGVARGVSETDAKQAYRQFIRAYHPDRFANHPPEFQRLAHEKTIQAQAALKAILAAQVTGEDRGQAARRQGELSDYGSEPKRRGFRPRCSNRWKRKRRRTIPTQDRLGWVQGWSLTPQTWSSTGSLNAAQSNYSWKRMGRSWARLSTWSTSQGQAPKNSSSTGNGTTREPSSTWSTRPTWDDWSTSS